MSWARIDDAFDDHAKVLALLEHEQGVAAIGLWTLCLTYAHRNTLRKGKTPGLIAASLPRRYVGPAGRDLAALLVKEGLWEARDDGDWMIHDFDQYLPTAKTSEARAEAGRKGAASRWAKKTDNGSQSKKDGNLPSGQDNLPGLGHDVDGKPMASDGSRAPAHRAISKEIAPVPDPVQKPPTEVPAGDSAPAELTVTQRSKRLTDAYHDAEPMSKWPAVNTAVIRAIQRNKWTDDEILAGLLRMAAENRSVTIDALRTELGGLPPRKASTTHEPYSNPANPDDYDEELRPR